MCLILNKNGKKTLFAPGLELEHAEECPEIDEVRCYRDYPGKVHPMNQIGTLLEEIGFASGKLGADGAGYGSAWGYRGPRLSEVVPSAEIVVDPFLIETHRMIKSDEEIALIKESCQMGQSGPPVLAGLLQARRTESEISIRASLDATLAMIKTLAHVRSHYAWAVRSKCRIQGTDRPELGTSSCHVNQRSAQARRCPCYRSRCKRVRIRKRIGADNVHGRA